MCVMVHTRPMYSLRYAGTFIDPLTLLFLPLGPRFVQYPQLEPRDNKIPQRRANIAIMLASLRRLRWIAPVAAKQDS